MTNRKVILHNIIIEKYKTMNPRVSLRAVAKKIGISSGRLSELLNEKRPLTDLYIEKFAHSLKLPAEDVNALREVQLRQIQAREKVNKKIATSDFNKCFTPEQIELSIDWKSLALMSFLQTSTYLQIATASSSMEEQMRKISRLMKIEFQEFTSIIQTMLNLEMIIWEDGHLVPANLSASTGYDIPNEFIKNAHCKTLEIAQEKLYSTDIYKRDFSSMMIALDPKDITRVKKMIRQFRRSLTTSLEKSKKTAVYSLAIQFFPVIDLDE